ncbi:hypothetical protein [Risungbinella massiliensis]|uniref:hypothetical protein n=1 Tax=Risungbinella massiliensis TaxID=1329796 RepID=UPI0005CC63C0|nr:hypothetical protein [Risungbinella massiliensis]
MDILQVVSNFVVAVGLIYIGFAAFRSIREGDLWRTIGIILAGGLAIAFVGSASFRDTVIVVVSQLFELGFPTKAS